MYRSALGVVAAALIAGALLAGTTLAAEPPPGSDDPTAPMGDPLVLSGVIVDPQSHEYLFFESIPAATGTEVALSGRFEVGPDGSFRVGLVRPQEAGPIRVFIVEAGDPETTAVDENGCSTEQRRGTTLEFDSAEAVEAGPVTVRLTDVYSAGLCPPAVGTSDGRWGPIGSDPASGAGAGSGASGDVASEAGAPPLASPTLPLAARGTVAGPGGARVTPPPTETSAVESAGSSPWLVVLALALLGVFLGLAARRRRAIGRGAGV